MLPVRSVARRSVTNSLRASRSQAIKAGARRHATTDSATGGTTGSHAAVGLGAGVAGGLIAYGIWALTPSGRIHSKINKAAYEAQSYYKEAGKKFQEKTPGTDQALDALKKYAHSYVSWIPGGSAVIDSTFNDLEKIRQNHGKEVDELVNQTYGDLQQITSEGLSMDALQKTVDVLNKFAKRIGSLAGGSIMELMDNHPQLKDKFGGPLQQLQQMGDAYGPEAKKQVDETWKQLQDIFQGGLSAGALYKAKSLLEEKTQQIRGMGDEAWKKGLEQVKPMLDKNPKLKELIEKNESKLKQGNFGELFQKVSSSLTSGNTQDLEQYVNQAVEKAKSAGSGMSLGGFGGFEQFARMIPGGDQIVPKLSKLKDVAENHKDEGKQLLEETIAEIQKVVSKQADKAQSLIDKASR